MKIHQTTQIRRLAWIAVACGSVLLLAVVLSSLLFHPQVLAQPTVETTADLKVGKEVTAAANSLNNDGTYKIVSREVAAPGDLLTYTIVLNNISTLNNVTAQVTDPLHPLLEYVAESAHTIPPDIGTLILPPPESGTVVSTAGITWTVDVTRSTAITLSFQARVSDSTDDGAIVANTVTVDDNSSVFQRSVTVTVDIPPTFVYLPLIFRRCPPLPYAPILHDIDNPDQSKDYTVSWSYDYDIPATSYTLEEATDSSFTNPTEYSPLYTTSRDFTKEGGGTYYYRVRAHNLYGHGPWSDVKSTTVAVFSYFDDFSDYTSGWPRMWDKTRGALYQVRPYEHPDCPGSDCKYDEGEGYVIARRSISFPYARFGPGVAVPSANYEIELDSRWWDAAYFATYQIFFGADSSFSDYYVVEVRIDNPESSTPKCSYRVRRQKDASDMILHDWDERSASIIHCKLGEERPDSSWNHWRIRREDDLISVYVNNNRLGSWQDSAFGANRYFGVGCTLYEGFTPSKPEFDNWSVVELE